MRNFPTPNERLNSLVMEGEINGAVFLSILPEMPSGREALLVSIESNRLNTSERILSDITAEG